MIMILASACDVILMAFSRRKRRLDERFADFTYRGPSCCNTGIYIDDGLDKNGCIRALTYRLIGSLWPADVLLRIAGVMAGWSLAKTRVVSRLFSRDLQLLCSQLS
jgi:hypothetical protein